MCVRLHRLQPAVISDILAAVRCYAAYIGSYLQTFRGNLSVPSLRVKLLTLGMGLGRSVNNDQSIRRNFPEERTYQGYRRFR
jgi:hypothetical protein